MKRLAPAFLIALALAILLRKSFCAWVCPIGFLSEALARLGRRMFGRNFRIWRFLDIPLRGLKYLLLGFFVWAIFGMSQEALHAFIESPYNRLSDIKTGAFFVELTSVGISVLGWTMLPPPASTFLIVSSIASTPIVITGAGVSFVRCIRPPLIAPGSVGIRVFSSTGTVMSVV